MPSLGEADEEEDTFYPDSFGVISQLDGRLAKKSEEDCSFYKMALTASTGTAAGAAAAAKTTTPSTPPSSSSTTT